MPSDTRHVFAQVTPSLIREIKERSRRYGAMAPTQKETA